MWGFKNRVILKRMDVFSSETTEFWKRNTMVLTSFMMKIHTETFFSFTFSSMFKFVHTAHMFHQLQDLSTLFDPIPMHMKILRYLNCALITCTFFTFPSICYKRIYDDETVLPSSIETWKFYKQSRSQEPYNPTLKTFLY